MKIKRNKRGLRYIEYIEVYGKGSEGLGREGKRDE